MLRDAAAATPSTGSLLAGAENAWDLFFRGPSTSRKAGKLPLAESSMSVVSNSPFTWAWEAEMGTAVSEASPPRFQVYLCTTYTKPDLTHPQSLLWDLMLPNETVAPQAGKAHWS